MSADPSISSNSALTKLAATCAGLGLSMFAVLLLQPQAVWLLAGGLLLMVFFICIVVGQSSIEAPFRDPRVGQLPASKELDSDLLCAPTTFAAKPVWRAPARHRRQHDSELAEDGNSRTGFRSTLTMPRSDMRRAA